MILIVRVFGIGFRTLIDDSLQGGMLTVPDSRSLRGRKRSGGRRNKSGRRPRLIARVAEGDDWWVGSDEQLFTTFYTMNRGTWPSVEKGVEVKIDVHSVLEGSLDKERSACRCLRIRTDLSFQPDQLFILHLRLYFRWKLRIL
jgi:hypothetical protein